MVLPSDGDSRRDMRKSNKLTRLAERLRRIDGLVGTQYWRERVLNRMLTVGFWVCIPVCVVSIIVSVLAGEYILVGAIVLGFLDLTWLVTHKRYPFSARAVAFLAAMFLAAAVLVLRLGPVAAGDVWLFAYLVFGSILFGTHRWPLLIIPVLALMVATGFLVHRALLPWETDLLSFTVVSVNFLAISMAVAVTIAVLTTGLRMAVYRESRLVSRLKRKTEELGASLDHLERKNTENAVLMREVQHRVNNNLQIMVGTLALDGGCRDDVATVKAARARIGIMARIQNLLLDPRFATAVSVKSILEETAADLLDLHDSFREVIVRGDDLYVGADSALLVALAANEILMELLDTDHHVGLTLDLKADGRIEIGLADRRVATLPEPGPTAHALAEQVGGSVAVHGSGIVLTIGRNVVVG